MARRKPRRQARDDGGDVRIVDARVRGRGRVLFAALRVGEQRLVQRDDAPIRLEVDGAEVEVELHEGTRYGPIERVTGPWERVSAHPAAALFASRAPAPHERVELRAFAIAPGDPIALLASVEERELSGGGPREPAIARLRRVRAARLARGAGAAAELDRLAPAGRGPKTTARAGALRGSTLRRYEGAMLAIGAALGGAALLAKARPLAADLAIAATSAIVMTLALHRARTMPLTFHRASGEPVGKGLPGTGIVAFMFVVTFAMMNGPTGADIRGDLVDGKPPCATPLVAALNLVMWAVALVSLTVQEWRSSRLASALLGARPHADPPREGEWGVVDGRIVAAAREEAPVLASIFEEEYREGSSPNVTAYRGSASPFAVALGTDRRVQVRPDGILWGSASRTEAAFDVATAAHKKVVLAERTLEPGAAVVVAGRLRDGALVSTSPESLLAFGAPAEEAPRTALAWALWSGRALRLAIAVGLVVLFAIAYWHPGLPPLNMPSSD